MSNPDTHEGVSLPVQGEGITLYLGQLTSRLFQEIDVPLFQGPDGIVGVPFRALRAIVRQRGEEDDAVIWVGGAEHKPEVYEYDDDALRIDVDRAEVEVDGALVKLAAGEFDVLAYMARNPGRAVSHQEIWEQCWGTEVSRPRSTLQARVTGVRNALYPNKNDPRRRIIAPARGRTSCYVFNPPGQPTTDS